MKKYPFSMKKEGHNIQLAYDYLLCKAYDDTLTDKELEMFERLRELYAETIGEPVAWLAGPDYGFMRDVAAWAVIYRDKRNHEK